MLEQDLIFYACVLFYTQIKITGFFNFPFRIFSRQAIIIFERPNPQHPSQVMADKKAALDRAAKKASTGFLEALCLVEKYLDPSSVEDRASISARTEMMFPGRIRSPEIYAKVMWFTVEVSII